MKINNVLMVEPGAPTFHNYSGYVMPRVGLPALGAVLKEAGVGVRGICEDLGKVRREDIAAADLVGISLTTSTAQRGYAIAEIAKKAGVPTAFGGVHATFLPEETLRHGDYCLRGEADETLLPLVRAIEGEGELADVTGLSFRKNGEIVHNPGPKSWVDLDTLPTPDFSTIRHSEKLKIIPVVTSRGCPFNCLFCSVTPMFGKRYRVRDTSSVLEELRRYPGKFIFFADDNFAADRRRAKELLHRVISELPAMHWSAQVRTDVARDGELLRLMKESGCFSLCIGLESVNPRTLKAYRKDQDLADIRSCIREIHSNRIRIHGMFVLGSDDDDRRTIRETLSFCRRMGLNTIQLLVLTPLPGTACYRTLQKEGRILSHDWSFYDGNHVVYMPRRISPMCLQRDTYRSMKRFYSAWECVKLFLRLRFLDWGIRQHGRRIVRKWGETNVSFMKRLGEWTRRYRKKILGHRRGPAATAEMPG